MSGFLARLVRRAQGRAAIAHPLLPPRFASGLARRAPDEIETLETVRPATPHEDVRPPALRSHAGTPPVTVIDQPAPAGHLRFDEASPERLASRQVPLESGRPRAGVTPRAAETSIAPLVQAPLERREPTRASPRERTLIDAPAPVVRGRPGPVVSPAPPRERAAAAAARRAPAPPRRTLEIAPLSASNRAAPRAVEPAPSAPVVQIRIGRVEVRAVMPAPAPLRTSAPRPPAAVSLEEHLRRKDGR